jgi:hypothetical protein
LRSCGKTRSNGKYQHPSKQASKSGATYTSRNKSLSNVSRTIAAVVRVAEVADGL